MEKVYNISAGPKYDLIAAWIGNNKKILDVGCGAGDFSARLSAQGNHVVGIESSEKASKISKQYINVLCGDFLTIVIREKFDIVLFADVLEHLLQPDAAMQKARELADEMILCVPNFEFWMIKILKLLGIKKMKSGILDKNHVFYFNKDIIEKMITENGYQIIDFASPAPKKLPSIYNNIIKINPFYLGYQYIYRCHVNN
jgi:O-antigen biosynthesis protein